MGLCLLSSEALLPVCLCCQKASKEPILEEAELDFRPLEECDEGLEEEDSQPPETKETQNGAKREGDRKEGQIHWSLPPVITFLEVTNNRPTSSIKRQLLKIGSVVKSFLCICF